MALNHLHTISHINAHQYQNQQASDESLPYEIAGGRTEMSFDAIIKPKPKEESTFAKLTCTEKDQTTITEIVQNIAEHGKFWLLKHRGYMTELGDSVRHVHPLKFLEIVFTNEYLVSCMFEIFDDYFKRNGMMDGLGERLTVNSQIGELDRFIQDFAKSIQVTPDGLKPYIEVKDWEGLVRYLMELKLNPEIKVIPK